MNRDEAAECSSSSSSKPVSRSRHTPLRRLVGQGSRSVDQADSGFSDGSVTNSCAAPARRVPVPLASLEQSSLDQLAPPATQNFRVFTTFDTSESSSSSSCSLEDEDSESEEKHKDLSCYLSCEVPYVKSSAKRVLSVLMEGSREDSTEQISSSVGSNNKDLFPGVAGGGGGGNLKANCVMDTSRECLTHPVDDQPGLTQASSALRYGYSFRSLLWQKCVATSLS